MYIADTDSRDIKVWAALVIANKGFCVGIVSLVCIFSESPLMPQGFLKKCCGMLQNAAKYCKNAIICCKCTIFDNHYLGHRWPVTLCIWYG